MCVVHENFKCVVIVNDEEVRKLDPPFLNRFEKQFISINEVMSRKHLRIVGEIEKILKQLIPKEHTKDNIDMIIPLLSDHGISSLVLKISNEFGISSEEELLDICLHRLLLVSKPEAVICFHESPLNHTNDALVKKLVDFYSGLPLQRGIHGFLEELNRNVDTKLSSHSLSIQSGKTGLYIVLTHDNIHSSDELRNDKTLLVSVVADITSVKEISGVIENFFKSETYEHMFIHFDAIEYVCHADVIKNEVEMCRETSRSSQVSKKKLCFMVLHFDRDEETKVNMDFSSDWTYIYLDSICGRRDTIAELCQLPVIDILQKYKGELKKSMQKELPWAFTRIQYDTGCKRSLEQIKDYIKHLSCEEVLEYMFEIAQRTIHRTFYQMKNSEAWIKSIAQSINNLNEMSTFRGAISKSFKRTSEIFDGKANIPTRRTWSS